MLGHLAGDKFFGKCFDRVGLTDNDGGKFCRHVWPADRRNLAEVRGRQLKRRMCHNFTTSNILLLKNPVFSESREVNVLHLDFRKFLTMALCFFVGLFGSSLVNDDFGAS